MSSSTTKEQFQKVSDAYYVLSDPKRRNEYDKLYQRQKNKSSKTYQGGKEEFDPMRFFKTFFQFDPSSQPSSSSSNGNDRATNAGHTDPNLTFATVFEDMMKPEIEGSIPVWKYLGTLSGATMGFILGSLPGLVMGSVAGNRLGTIRDAKGKSVYAVFSDLDGHQKAMILKGLAMKVLRHTLS